MAEEEKINAGENPAPEGVHEDVLRQVRGHLDRLRFGRIEMRIHKGRVTLLYVTEEFQIE